MPDTYPDTREDTHKVRTSETGGTADESDALSKEVTEHSEEEDGRCLSAVMLILTNVSKGIETTIPATSNRSFISWHLHPTGTGIPGFEKYSGTCQVSTKAPAKSPCIRSRALWNPSSRHCKLWIHEPRRRSNTQLKQALAFLEPYLEPFGFTFIGHICHRGYTYTWRPFIFNSLRRGAAPTPRALTVRSDPGYLET